MGNFGMECRQALSYGCPDGQGESRIEKYQEDDVNSGHSWAGTVCCFVLFITLCLILLLNMNSTSLVPGDPEFGLLFFTLPGVVAGFISRPSRVLRPLLGAVLAACLSLALTRFFLISPRSFWQELAWLFSAVFWCGLGALFISAVLHAKKRRRR